MKICLFHHRRCSGRRSRTVMEPTSKKKKAPRGVRPTMNRRIDRIDKRTTSDPVIAKAMGPERILPFVVQTIFLLPPRREASIHDPHGRSDKKRRHGSVKVCPPLQQIQVSPGTGARIVSGFALHMAHKAAPEPNPGVHPAVVMPPNPFTGKKSTRVFFRWRAGQRRQWHLASVRT